MSSIDLPRELCDKIIDTIALIGAKKGEETGVLLVQTTVTLKSCSLVCRAFADRARTHLFQYIRLVDRFPPKSSSLENSNVRDRDYALVDPFVQLLDRSPHLGAYVKRLKLISDYGGVLTGTDDPHFWNPDVLQDLVKYLTKVEDLRLDGPVWNFTNNSDILFQLGPVKKLQIINPQVHETFRSYQAFISSYPLLVELHLNVTLVSPIVVEQSIALPRLETLSCWCQSDGLLVEAVRQWYTLEQDQRNIQKLSLHVLQPSLHPMVAGLLRQVGKYLCELTLEVQFVRVDGIPPRLTLPNMDCLQAFSVSVLFFLGQRFGLTAIENSTSAVCDLLSDLSSKQLRSINIHFKILLIDQQSPSDCSPLQNIDALFRNKRWKDSLGNFLILIHSASDLTEMERQAFLARIRGQLPTAEARGMLKIVEVGRRARQDGQSRS